MGKMAFCVRQEVECKNTHILVQYCFFFSFFFLFFGASSIRQSRSTRNSSSFLWLFWRNIYNGKKMVHSCNRLFEKCIRQKPLLVSRVTGAGIVMWQIILSDF